MDVALGGLAVVLGALIAAGSAYLVERRRDERERQAWERSRAAEREDWERARAAEREDRRRESQRGVIQDLQELAYAFCGAVAAEGAERVQLGGDLSAERRSELSSIMRSAVVLLNRVEDDELGRQLDDYFASRWFVLLVKTPEQAIEGAQSIIALWESLNERLRRRWIALA